MASDEEILGKGLERFREYLNLVARTQMGWKLRRKLDSSDLVQETLMDAHRGRQQFRGTTDAETAAWLREIMQHNILDAVRAFAREKRDLDREIDLEQAVSESRVRIESWLANDQSSPSERAMRNEQLLQLSHALARLPELQREAVELFHLQGCSLAEIASLLNRSQPAVAGLLHRGLKRLRELIDVTAIKPANGPLPAAQDPPAAE